MHGIDGKKNLSGLIHLYDTRFQGMYFRIKLTKPRTKISPHYDLVD
jgi:hypothetical protein